MLFGPRHAWIGALGLAAIISLIVFHSTFEKNLPLGSRLSDAQAVLEHAGCPVNRAKPDEIGAIRGNFTVRCPD
jgi:hypothetical protein